MTEQENDFLRLAVVEQITYSEISKILKIDKTKISNLWDKLKQEREQLSAIRKIWKSKFTNTDAYESFWGFRDWYINSKRECHYCKITENELHLLWEKTSDLTKRKRGRKLEIERLMPNEDYDNIKNLVYSCYWCNNAKTDTFSESEFKSIGEEISKIWKNRLKK
ncbi:MAG: hypothetical protein DRJ01_15040 [Bacteroidetes bacterium]|nr:MAG: hypothetical protein DRJ01_15040 [Bacteroidota bacterium]